jgi:hypothetical protein
MIEEFVIQLCSFFFSCNFDVVIRLGCNMIADSMALMEGDGESVP